MKRELSAIFWTLILLGFLIPGLVLVAALVALDDKRDTWAGRMLGMK